MSTAGINAEAVASLRQERIDWRFKGLPDAAFGRTVGEFLAARPAFSDSGFVGPVLTLDAAALEHNLRTMAGWCDQHGIALAPHGKTTMAPQLFQRQLEHGAWGITAANLSQLRVYRAFGVRRVLLANQLVDPAGLRWLARELDEDPEWSVACWVDSVRSVELMSEALASCGASRPLDVLVELGYAGARTGVRTAGEAIEVARAVAASPALRLRGVGGYEGALTKGTDAEALELIGAYVGRLRTLVWAVAEEGLFDATDDIIVTCGGSSYFDQVAEALLGPWPEPLRVVPVLRSGAYLTHDDGLYRALSPFGRAHRLAEGASPFRPALRLWAQVTSRPEPGLALLTMGRRDASFDADLPEPQVVRTISGAPRAMREPITRLRVTALADQHAFLSVPADSEIEVGDWVGCGLSHPCTVFDKWPLIPVVDGDRVVDLIRTFF